MARERLADLLAGFGFAVTVRLPSRLNAALQTSSSRAKTPR
jgi:hypothetical protein